MKMPATRSLKSKLTTILRKNIDVFALASVISVLAVISCIFIYKTDLNGPPIRSDGYTYYSYLPTIFIDKDLSFQSAKENVPRGTTLQMHSIGVYPQTGRMLNIVPHGTAVLQLPFFIAADVYTRVTDTWPRSGYSVPYQAAIIASGIFYLTAGSVLLYVTLRRLFGKHTALIAVIAIVFATNLFHYGTYDNSFSHVYSFAVVSMLLLLLFRLREYGVDKLRDKRYYLLLIGAGISIGFIAAIRIPDVLMALLLVAMLYENKRTFPVFIRDLAIAGSVGLLVLAPYFVYLVHTTGSLFANPYTVFKVKPGIYDLGSTLEEETYGGFTNLRNPELINFLFSVRKGLLFWAPVLILAFVSLIALIKRFKWLGLAVLTFLGVQIYLCASWWAWAFGGSFGARPFVNYMPLLALSLAAGIAATKKYVDRRIIWIICGILITINLLLTYAYWRGYIGIDGTTFEILMKVPKNLWTGH